MEATAATKPTTPEEAARAAFDRLRRHDLSNPEQMWGPDSVDHFMPVGEFRGTEQIADYFRGLFAAVPDLDVDVRRIIADGPFTTVQWHATGTFTGQPFLGIEPTGRRVEIEGVDVIEWDDEMRVKHNTIYYDGAEFARQIGMLPPRDSTADRAITGMFNGVTKLRAKLRR